MTEKDASIPDRTSEWSLLGYPTNILSIWRVQHDLKNMPVTVRSITCWVLDPGDSSRVLLVNINRKNTTRVLGSAYRFRHPHGG